MAMTQELYAESVVQNYPVGMRYARDDRVFRYCLAGPGVVSQQGAFNNHTWPINAALTAQANAGATTMSVPDAAGALNAYAGGWIAIYTGNIQFRRIKSNTVSDGVNVVLTFYDALTYVAAIGTWCTGYPSIYSDVRGGCVALELGFVTFVVVPMFAVTNGRYFWGQTWGPCVTSGGTPSGATIHTRDVYFFQTGDIVPATAGDCRQRAGTVLPFTSNGNGDAFFMLEISP